MNIKLTRMVRLKLLENVLQAPGATRMLKVIGKANDTCASLANKFDGDAELLDDLKDHCKYDIH